MNMSRIIICFLAFAAVAGSCKKDDNLPKVEDKLESAARTILSNTVYPSVDLLDFCLDFQQYLDAPADDKILEKYQAIRKSVSKTGDYSYVVTSYDNIPSYGKFTTNGAPIDEEGGKMVFDDISYTVACIGKGEWQIMLSGPTDYTNELYGYYLYRSDDRYDFTLTYRKTSAEENVGTLELEGTLLSNDDKTSGYTAKYRTLGDFKQLGYGSFSGAFRIETFDASGKPLHDYTLNL